MEPVTDTEMDRVCADIRAWMRAGMPGDIWDWIKEGRKDAG